MFSAALLAVPVVSSAGGEGGGDSCFPAGTQISLPDGDSVNIEEVKVGDVVRSYDVKTNSFVEAKVLELESPIREGYYEINGDLLRVTNEHPLYTKKGWASIVPEVTYEDTKLRPIAQLEIGAEVFTEDGWVEVESIEYVEGELRTYNLKTVDKYNAFFADGVLAHNKNHGGGIVDAVVDVVNDVVDAIGDVVDGVVDTIGDVANDVVDVVVDVANDVVDVVVDVVDTIGDFLGGDTNTGGSTVSGNELHAMFATELTNTVGSYSFTQDGVDYYYDDSIGYNYGGVNEGDEGEGPDGPGGLCTVQSCTISNACGSSTGQECVNGIGSYSCNATNSAPSNLGDSCTETNACGVGTGTIQCNGQCSVTGATIPSDYGDSCTETSACGPDTGTIQCSGSCSTSGASVPSNYGQACNPVPENSCGSQNPGTYTCGGTCSTTAPPNPPGYGTSCQESNRCGSGSVGTQQCDGSCSEAAPTCDPATGSVAAQPLLVLSGGTTSITWTTQLALDCSVSGTNGDNWTGVSGNETTGAITEETTYTLYCVEGDFTDTTTVQVAPAWQEF